MAAEIQGTSNPGEERIGQLLEGVAGACEAYGLVEGVAGWLEIHARAMRHESEQTRDAAFRQAGVELAARNAAGELSVTAAAAAVTRLQQLDPRHSYKLEPGFDITERIGRLREGTPVIGLSSRFTSLTGVVEAVPSSLVIHEARGRNTGSGPVAVSPGYLSPSAELTVGLRAVGANGATLVTGHSVSVPGGFFGALVGTAEIQAAADSVKLVRGASDDLLSGEVTNVGKIRDLRHNISELAMLGVEIDTTHIDEVVAGAANEQLTAGFLGILWRGL